MKKVFILLAISLLVLSGCGKKEKQKQTIESKTRTTDIEILKVKLENIKDIYTVPGVVEAWDDITIPSETSGPISWIGVEEGDFVKKGDPILKINTDNLLANLNSAKVQLDDDYKEFLRQDNLYKQKAVSQKQFDSAKRTYELSKVSYQLALDEFNKSTVKSPVTGVIDSIPPKIGEYVSPGTEIARLIDQSKLKIYVNIPENDVKYLTLGQSVDVYVAEIGKSKSIKKGQINYISAVADPSTLTHKTRIDISLDDDIRPGRIVRADIVRKNYENVIIVDLYTVVDKDGKKVVYINENGVAKERPVEMGDMIGRRAVILSGLQEGEELIVSGQQFLTDNAPVNLPKE